MSRSALSEQVNRLLPGEKWKRVREAILQSATYSGQRLDTLRRNIDQENRLKDGKLQDGNLEFPISTTAELDLFVWVINYQIFQPGFTNLPVLAHDPDFPRPDVFTGDGTGTIKYYPGTIDSEGNGQFPDIPEGEVILREVIRNTDGSNDSTPGNGNGNGKYVSLNDTGTQVVKSYLGSEPLAGSLRDSLYPDANGVFRKTRVDYHGVYSTVEGVGATDWSKIVSINVAGGQLRYFVMLEFAGVSPAMEKGMVWIQFETDGSGNLTVNKLKVFGEINPAKLKMVKLDANTYGVFVHHNEAGAFFKFRPQFSFGGSTVYDYRHQDGRAALPAGTQYEFEQYSDNPFTEDEIASIQNAEAPTSLNPVVTVSKLNSYAYVQEAPSTGSHYARKDGVWVAFTPFTVSGTPTDGHVVASVGGVPTWQAPSGGGSSEWAVITNGIGHDGPVGISANSTIPAVATANVALTLRPRGANTSIYEILLVRNWNDTADLLKIRNDGALTHLANAAYFGANHSSYTASQGYYFKIPGTGVATAVSVLNGSNSSLLDIKADGTVTLQKLVMSASVLSIGSSSTPSNGFTFKASGSSSAASFFRVQSNASGEPILFDIYGDGRVFFSGSAACIHHIGNPSSPNNNFSYKAQANYNTTSAFQVQRASGNNMFEIFSGGRICMYEIETSDPLVFGALWEDAADGFTIKRSQG